MSETVDLTHFMYSAKSAKYCDLCNMCTVRLFLTVKLTDSKFFLESKPLFFFFLIILLVQEILSTSLSHLSCNSSISVQKSWPFSDLQYHFLLFFLDLFQL